MQWLFRVMAGVMAVVLLQGCTSMLGRYNSTRPVWVSVSPHGDHLALVWCNSGPERLCTIALLDPVSGVARLYENHTGRHWRSPAFSKDGKRLVMSVRAPQSEDSHIAVMDSDGQNFEVLTNNTGTRYAPSFSADGRSLVYICTQGWTDRYYTPYRGNTKRTRNRELCLYDLDKSEERRITALDAYSYSAPTFLPDGRHVAVHYEDSQYVDGSFEQISRNVMIDTETQKMFDIQIMENPTATGPRVSSDGTRMVFYARANDTDGKFRGYNYDLFVWSGTDVMSHTGPVKRLTRMGSYLSGFGLSADGQTVAFWMDKKRNGENRLYMMGTDGTNLREVELPKAPTSVIAQVVP